MTPATLPVSLDSRRKLACQKREVSSGPTGCSQRSSGAPRRAHPARAHTPADRVRTSMRQALSARREERSTSCSSVSRPGSTGATPSGGHLARPLLAAVVVKATRAPRANARAHQRRARRMRRVTSTPCCEPGLHALRYSHELNIIADMKHLRIVKNQRHRVATRCSRGPQLTRGDHAAVAAQGGRATNRRHGLPRSRRKAGVNPLPDHAARLRVVVQEEWTGYTSYDRLRRGALSVCREGRGPRKHETQVSGATTEPWFKGPSRRDGINAALCGTWAVPAG